MSGGREDIERAGLLSLQPYCIARMASFWLEGRKFSRNGLLSSQDAFDDVVKYFGENPKTTPPSVFFPVFVRFVKAYKVRFCGPEGSEKCPTGPGSAWLWKTWALNLILLH